MVLPAGFEPAISGLRIRDPGPLDDDSVAVARRMARAECWLLEQDSNLQALRHLINNQARLPNFRHPGMKEDERAAHAHAKTRG